MIMKNRFADFIIEKRLPVVLGFLAVTVVFLIAAATGLTFKPIDTALRPEGYPNIKLEDEARKIFGGTNQLYIALQVRDKADGGAYDDIFNYETLQMVKDIDTALRNPELFPGIDRNKMFDLYSAKLKDIQITSAGMNMTSIMFPDVPKTKEEIDQLRMKVYQGIPYPVLVSFDSKTTVIMADFLEGKDDYDDIFHKLQDLRKKYENKNISVLINCLPVERGFIKALTPSVVKMIGISALLIFIILFLSLGSVQGAVIALLAGILSSIWGLGFLGFFKFNLDPALFGLPLFISMIALANAAFFIKRFAIERAAGTGPVQAAKATIIALYSPCATAMLIAGICLVLVALAPLRGIRPLFLSGFFWAFASFIIAAGFVPALLTYMPVAPQKAKEAKFMKRSARWICGWGKYAVAAVMLLAIIMGFTSMKTIYYGNASPGSPTLLAWHRYNMDAFKMSFAGFGYFASMNILAQGDEKSAINDNPALLRDTMEFCRFLARTPMDPKMGPVVAAPVYVLQSLPGRSRGTHENDPNWSFVPTNDEHVKMFYMNIISMAAPGSMDKFIDTDQKAMCMYIYCRDKTESVIKPLMQRIREYITQQSPFGIRHSDEQYPDKFMRSLDSLITKPEPLLPEKPQVDKLPHVYYRIGGGPVGIQADVNDCVRLYFFWTFVIASLAILIITAVRFGSVAAGITALLPLLFTVVIPFKYLSIPNTAFLTVETLPYIMIGYGLFSAGILYMLSSIAAAYAASKSWEQAIADAMSTTGKVSMYIAMSILVGFIYVLGPFTMPHFMPLSATCNLFIIMGLCSMIATIFAVPAFIALFKPQGIARGGRE
jgi:uncharacterized protein